MSFAAPELLALMLVVAVIGVMAYRLARWRTRARSAFAGPQASRWRETFSLAATVFLLEAAALIVIAIARPVWGTNELTRERQGVDIVFVLDISASMQGTDVQPTRLGVAQEQLNRLVEAERGNRFGLVLFAGTSILRSPLTTDAAAMTELISRAGGETSLVRSGSDLGAALEQAGLILDASESAGKAVLVVSDGEDFGGNFTARAQELRDKDVVVLTAGAGTTQGSQLTELNRLGDQVTKMDASGRPIVTRLNESNLRQTASAGGGRYVHLSGDTTLLGFREDLSRLKQTPLGAETRDIPVQRFQLFAAAAFALLLISWCVPMRLGFLRRLSMPRVRLRRPNPGVALLLLALLIGACSGQETIRSRNQQANDAYNRGSYQEALDTYHELIAQRPDIAELSINAGNALNRAGLFSRAVQETQRALPPSDDHLGALTYYALGNHYFRLQEFELAADSYRNSLVLDPTDQDAKYNLELTLLVLTGQIEEPQQQQPEGQQPSPDQQGDQGDQQPNPDGSPQPSQSPQDPAQQPGGQPQPGQGDQEGQPGSASDVQRQLQDALRGLNENLTYEEAQRILDLLQQQQQEQRLPGGGTTPSGPDY